MSKIVSFMFLFAFGFAAISQAAVPIKPDDDAQAVERINTYNLQQTEAARTLFRNRVLGTRDDGEADSMPLRKGSAQDKAAQQLQLREQNEASRAAARNANQENRCEQVEARINNRINQYESNIDRHTARLNGIKDKLDSMIEALQGKGCEVSQLSTLVANLDSKITESGALYRSFITEFQGSRSVVCQERNTEFVSMVKNSNAKLTQFRRETDLITKFIKDEVRPAFKAAAATCLASETQE
jgi:archaellum component FlaC